MNYIRILLGLLVIIIPIGSEYIKDKQINNKILIWIFKSKWIWIFSIVIVLLFIAEICTDRHYIKDKKVDKAKIDTLNRKIDTLNRKNDSLIIVVNASYQKICRIESYLKDFSTENFDYLNEKYNTGYILFYGETSQNYNYAHFRTPFNSRLISNYSIDYRKITIVNKLYSDWYTFTMPSFEYTGETVVYSWSNSYDILLEEKFMIECTCFNLPDCIYFEVLKVDKHELIYCIGFRDINT